MFGWAERLLARDLVSEDGVAQLPELLVISVDIVASDAGGPPLGHRAINNSTAHWLIRKPQDPAPHIQNVDE